MGFDFKELWKIYHDAINRRDVAGIISGRKGQKNRDECVEISQCLPGVVFSKLLPPSATTQTPIFILLCWVHDSKLTLSSIAASHSILLKLPFWHAGRGRLLWLESFRSWLVLCSNSAVFPHRRRNLKSVLRSLSFDVSPYSQIGSCHKRFPQQDRVK